MILDTGALLAAFDPDEARHEACAAVLADARNPLLSPFVACELDSLIRRNRGVTDELRFLDLVARRALPLAPFEAGDVALAISVIDHYRDLDLGLTDASLIVLAHRHRTHDLFTLDERPFRNVAALDGRPFRLLPADA